MSVTPTMPDPPKTCPLERFWPYADLPELPTEEELAKVDPNLHEALFGQTERRFSITFVFPALDMPDFPRALELAREAAEFREMGRDESLRYRARFWSSDAKRLRELYQIVGRSGALEILIDEKPLPYTRELWLPLVWLVIPW